MRLAKALFGQVGDQGQGQELDKISIYSLYVMKGGKVLIFIIYDLHTLNKVNTEDIFLY